MDRLVEFVLSAPGNRVPIDEAVDPSLVGTRIYDAPLVAVADATDPLFGAMRSPQVVGDHFRLPEQWLPGAKRVVSFFLPYSAEVKKTNFSGTHPSTLWLIGRVEGQSFLMDVCRWLQSKLESTGACAVIPASSPDFWAKEAPDFTSNWSERHVAFIAGLGTFGLSRGLITEKGMCGRFGSLVTTAELPVTKRAYSQIYEYCTGCGACIHRCPVSAITDKGKDNVLCANLVNSTKRLFAPRFGCGKCQVRVPCMDRIPLKPRK